MFLEPAEGEAGINNILKMAREGLRSALATSLHKAVKNKQSALCPGLRVKTNGHHTLVNLAVRPVTSGPAPPPAHRCIWLSWKKHRSPPRPCPQRRRCKTPPALRAAAIPRQPAHASAHSQPNCSPGMTN